MLSPEEVIFETEIFRFWAGRPLEAFNTCVVNRLILGAGLALEDS